MSSPYARNRQIHWSPLLADRMATIQEALALIQEAGAGVEQRNITHDASMYAPADNTLYLAHIRAGLEAYLESKNRLPPGSDWPARTFVPKAGVPRGGNGD